MHLTSLWKGSALCVCVCVVHICKGKSWIGSECKGGT